METETIQLNADTSRGAWRVYTHETEESATVKFVQKFGHPPEYIVEENGQLWLGPVQERIENGHNQ